MGTRLKVNGVTVFSLWGSYFIFKFNIGVYTMLTRLAASMQPRTCGGFSIASD